tara:strand:+ start:5324 stop:5614 length:291 start_codon:yes stop_codon:yes gene_type:complete
MNTTPDKLDSGKAMADAARIEAEKINPNLSDSWMAYDFRHVANGIMAIGSDTRPLKSGPNKGMPTALNTNRLEVFISREMIDAQLEKQQSDDSVPV